MNGKNDKKRIKNAFSRICLITFLLTLLCGCAPEESAALSEDGKETQPEAVAGTDGTTEENTEGSTETTPEEITGEIPEEPEYVTILGCEYDINTEYLDLSGMKPADVREVSDAISKMPYLSSVNLIPEKPSEEAGSNFVEAGEEEPEEETTLTLEDVSKMKEAAPGVHFIYEFDLFGCPVSTADTEVRLVKKKIGNNEIMAQIREDHPGTKVVWRVHVGWKSALTDDPIIRMTHGINDSMTEPLKYCNEVVYMDLGHDGGISDISFIENMPLLECLILSDARITDLTPLTGCKKLEWLELISCGRIKDLSVIADMDSIKYLNISWTRISDISGIWDMDLDRFSCIDNGVPKETIEEYKETHPDCMCAFSGNPYGYAWRYDDYGYHYFSYYARMREVFRYDKGSPGGFKWPEETEETP